jgi:MOSC domain-containing protein YiiM
MITIVTGEVVAVARDSTHRFSKQLVDQIRLLEGIGVEGDAHAGVTVQHLSRLKRTPGAPNLRQVHLIAQELFDELTDKGFTIGPAVLGENVTTRGVDLLGLPRGAQLRLGADAVVEITGLRNPCVQLDDLQHGLLAQVLHRKDDGTVVRRAGVMAVVRAGGTVRPGDPIEVSLPSEPHEHLEPV